MCGVKSMGCPEKSSGFSCLIHHPVQHPLPPFLPLTLTLTLLRDRRSPPLPSFSPWEEGGDLLYLIFLIFGCRWCVCVCGSLPTKINPWIIYLSYGQQALNMLPLIAGYSADVLPATFKNANRDRSRFYERLSSFILLFKIAWNWKWMIEAVCERQVNTYYCQGESCWCHFKWKVGKINYRPFVVLSISVLMNA